jgi:hypothetical protein
MIEKKTGRTPKEAAPKDDRKKPFDWYAAARAKHGISGKKREADQDAAAGIFAPPRAKLTRDDG